VNRDDKFVLILAEDYRQASMIARDMGLSQRGRWTFVFDQGQMHGRDRTTTRVVVNQMFWRRRDAQEIVDVLRVMELPPETWERVTT
jgi:hypothetical protein